jgi:hypothetical protein
MMQQQRLSSFTGDVAAIDNTLNRATGVFVKLGGGRTQLAILINGNDETVSRLRCQCIGGHKILHGFLL